MTATPSTWPEDSSVLEPNPMRVIHRGRVHQYIVAHTRGTVSVKAHWRATSVAEPTNFEPGELFGGKTS